MRKQPISYAREEASHSREVTRTRADVVKSNKRQFLILMIEERNFNRMPLFNTSESPNETNKLMAMENTIPSTVKSVCTTTELPLTPIAANTNDTKTAITSRIVCLVIQIGPFLIIGVFTVKYQALSISAIIAELESVNMPKNDNKRF